jgi:Acetylornithine deacetylase/Succinyl-diaminopimelate desuccinylase and related deacylases
MIRQQLTDNEEIELKAILTGLIENKSYSGNEKNAVEFARKILEKEGFLTEVDENGSLTAVLEGTEKGRAVLFDGHIDTVRADNLSAWNTDPFTATEKDGAIYGRGASDMKGQDAAFLAAALRFKREKGRRFRGKLMLSLSVEEELFEGVSCRTISEHLRPDLVIIGEATDCRLNIGQRGRAEVELVVYGKSCHSANPEKGINAIAEAQKALSALEGAEVREDPLLGKAILVPTDIISSPYPGSSVIPDSVTVTFDRRLIRGETEDSVLEGISSVLKDKVNYAVRIRRADMTCYTGKVAEYKRFFPAWAFDADKEEVKNIRSALEKAGQAAELSSYSFCTNGSHFAGEKGILTLGYGPSRENLAHTANEYITIKDLTAGSLGYEAIMEAMLI